MMSEKNYSMIKSGPRDWQVHGMDPFAIVAIKVLAATHGETISEYLYGLMREVVLGESNTDLIRFLGQYELPVREQAEG